MFPSSYSFPPSSSSSSSSLSSARRTDSSVDIEQSQLVIRIKDAKVNYSKVMPVIDFKPYMLDLPPGGSDGIRLAIYLPDTHNVPYVFDKYLQLYKLTIGNPALVFTDKKAYAEYMQYARELVKKEKNKVDKLGVAIIYKPGPHQVTDDDDKVRMMNNNIAFIVNTLFGKTRIITTGAKKDRVQTVVAGKPVVVAQSYYMESYDMDEVTYTPSGGVKKYGLGDSIIFENEQRASDLKAEIDKKRAELKTKEKAWSDAKAAYTNARLTPPVPQPTHMQGLVDDVNKAKEEYNDVRIAEKEIIAERDKVVSEINLYRYGKENPKVDDILREIARLNETKEQNTRKKTVKEREKELEVAKKTELEKRLGELVSQLKEEYVRVLQSVFGDMTTGAGLAESTLNTRVNRLNNDLQLIRIQGHDASEIEKLENQQKLYNESKKYIDKLKDEKERIEDSRGSSSSSWSSWTTVRSSDSIRAIKSAIKKLDEEIRKIDDEIVRNDSQINAVKMKLEDYTLRVYVYTLKGAMLVTKYRDDGKKNPQFGLLEKKGYADAMQSSEYQKNASAMIKEAPMFSQASCLQKKTEIQKMLDNIMFETREKIKDALDEQEGGMLKASGISKQSRRSVKVKEETQYDSDENEPTRDMPKRRLGVLRPPLLSSSRRIKLKTVKKPSKEAAAKVAAAIAEAQANAQEVAEAQAKAKEVAEAQAKAKEEVAEAQAKAAAAKKTEEDQAKAKAAAAAKQTEEAEAVVPTVPAVAEADTEVAAAETGTPETIEPEKVSLKDKISEAFSKLKKNYNDFSFIEIIKRPEVPFNEKYVLGDDGRVKVECEATIKKSESGEVRERLHRVAATPMGKYPPFLMPQGYYEMHQLVYRPPTSTEISVDCTEPPGCHKDIVIKNIEKLLYRSNIPLSFPELSTSKDVTDYKDSIEMENSFVNSDITT